MFKQHATHVGHKLFTESFFSEGLCLLKGAKWLRIKGSHILERLKSLYLRKDRDWPWRWLSRPTGLPGVKPHRTQDITEMAFSDAFKLQHSDRHFTANSYTDISWFCISEGDAIMHDFVWVKMMPSCRYPNWLDVAPMKQTCIAEHLPKRIC